MSVFEVGNFKITTLEFGRFKLDGGAMFGVVPQTLWSRTHPPDESNRIEMALRCILVEIDQRKILVDTGFGKGRTAKFKEIYSFTGSEDYIDEGLATIGLERDGITDVFLTHLHFDHAGGSTEDKGGKPRPTFPNARYHLQQKQLEHARTRLERDKASYFPEDFEPLIEAGVLSLYDGNFEFLPGFNTIICNGHTPAMQLPKLHANDKTIVFAADLIPLRSQFPLPWIMAYDLYPVTTLEEKRRIFAEAARDNWLFIFEHDPEMVAGSVTQTEKGFNLAV